MAIPSELFEAQAEHDILTNRFASQLSNQVLPFLNELADFYRQRILAEDLTVRNKKRFKDMLRDIEQKTKEVTEAYTEIMLTELKEFGQLEAAFAVDSAQSVLTGNVLLSSSDNQRLWAAVRNEPMLIGKDFAGIDFEKFTKSFSESEIKKMGEIIRGGYFTGLTNQEMIMAMTGKKVGKNFVGGQLEITRNAADYVVRTSINHIATQSRLSVYDDNDDIISGYRIIATLDFRTSATCRSFDQKIVKNTDKYKPHPPFHPRCRTTVIPELIERPLDNSGFTRPSKFDGEVPASTQYYEALKSASPEKQNEVLGKVRGEMFRNSGLSVEKFRSLMTDRMGDPLTLSEMAKKNDTVLKWLKDSGNGQYI